MSEEERATEQRKIDALRYANTELKNLNERLDKPKEKMFIFDDKLFATEDDIAEYIKDHQERFIEGCIKDNLDYEIDELMQSKTQEIEF